MAKVNMVGGGPASGGGQYIPGMPNYYDPAFGGVPRVSDPTRTASTAIGGNLGNLSNIYQMATGAGKSAGAGVIEGLNQIIPGVSGSIGASKGVADQMMTGQLGEDEIAMLRQQAAEIGAGQGMGPMSPFSNASYLRALGLTSIGRKQQGQQALNALMGSVPHAPAFDPSSMFVTPGQQQEWDYMGQMMANAPRPAAAAKANMDALQRGTGYGSSGPVGGFNLPIKGGPAFSSPMLSGEYSGPVGIYGGTADPGQYQDEYYQSPGAYQNWANLARSWGGGGGTGGGGGSYYAGNGAIQDPGFAGPMDARIQDPGAYGYMGNEDFTGADYLDPENYGLY